MKLITGGSGLLVRWLRNTGHKPSHEELDITKPIQPKEYDTIIHCAAYTNTTKAETDRLECFDVNVRGTLNLLNAYPTTPFVFISSEYAHSPVNFYSLTKSLAEQLVTTHPNYLIIRTLFKPYPYPYDYAFTNQITQGDTVDIIAPLIDKAIMDWDGESKIMYIGTGRKTLYDLAKRSKPNVKGHTVEEWSKVTGIKYPRDYQ